MKTARRDETRERPQWWPIALIAIAAIVVRLIIAYVALPSDAGYTTDLQSFLQVKMRLIEVAVYTEVKNVIHLFIKHRFR